MRGRWPHPICHPGGRAVAGSTCHSPVVIIIISVIFAIIRVFLPRL